MYVKIPKEKIARMEIVKTNCKMTLSHVVAKYKCHYVINGGLYDMKTGIVSEIPLRYILDDGLECWPRYLHDSFN